MMMTILTLQQYFIYNVLNGHCTKPFPHSTVILREYFKNIPLKSCNIAKIFIKRLERFLKYCRNLAMSTQNIINLMLLQYWYFILILLLRENCHRHSYDVLLNKLYSKMKFRLLDNHYKNTVITKIPL